MGTQDIGFYSFLTRPLIFFPGIRRKCSYELVDNCILDLMEFSSLSDSRLEREEWGI